MFRKNFRYFLFAFVFLMVATTTFVVTTFLPVGNKDTDGTPSDKKIETVSTPIENPEKKEEDKKEKIVATKTVKIDETMFPAEDVTPGDATPGIEAVLEGLEIDLATVKRLEITVGSSFLGKTLHIDKVDCINLEELVIFYEESVIDAEDFDDYEKLFIVFPDAFENCTKIKTIDIDVNVAFTMVDLELGGVFSQSPLTRVIYTGEGTLSKENFEALGLDKDVEGTISFISAEYEDDFLEDYSWEIK